MEENRSSPYREYKYFKHSIPLAQAFKTGDVQKILQAIYSTSNLSDSLTDQNEKALHLACELGNMKLIAVLLERGAYRDVCKRTNQRKKPIEYAVEVNCTEAVTKLSGYSQCIENAQELYQLMMTAIRKNASESLKELLTYRYRYGVNIDQDKLYNTPLLQYAIGNKNLACVTLLIDAGANLLWKNENGANYLHYAAQAGNKEILQKLLLTQAKTLINEAIKGKSSSYREEDFQRQDTPLHIAIRNGNVESAQLLLSAGAKIHTENNEHSLLGIAIDKLLVLTKQKESRPFLEKAYTTSIAMIKLLLQINGYRDCNTVNSSKNINVFHKIIETGATQLIELFISHGAEVNALDTAGNNALLQLLKVKKMSATEMEKLINVLLSYKVDVTQINHEGYTALHLAVFTNNEVVMQILLNTEAKKLYHHPLALKNRYSQFHEETGYAGDTPLHIALRKNYFSMAELLIMIETDVSIKNEKEETALTLGMMANDAELMRLLLARVTHPSLLDELQRDDYGYQNYLICRAVHRGNVEIVRQLIAAGANVSLRDHNKAHVVYIAIKQKNAEMLAFLLTTAAITLIDQPCYQEKKKTFYFAADTTEPLPIHLAIQQKDASCLELLLQAGAKLYLEDIPNENYGDEDSDESEEEENSHFYQKNKDLEEKYSLPNTLLLAISVRSKKIVEVLLKHLCQQQSDFLKTYSVNGQPLLYFAIKNGDVEIIKILLAQGADVTHNDSYYGSCLQYIAKNMNTSYSSYPLTDWATIFCLLWEAGASVDKNTLDNNGDHLLHTLAAKGNIKLMVFLLQQGVDKFFSHKNKWGQLPLDMLLCEKTVDLEWIIALNIEEACWQTEGAQRFLFRLVSLVRYTIIQQMQGYSAEDKLILQLQKLPEFWLLHLLKQENIGDTTLMGAAIYHQQKKLAMWLLEKGVTLDTYEQSLKKNYISSSQSNRLFTPLALSIQYQELEIFDAVLKKSASIDNGSVIKTIVKQELDFDDAGWETVGRGSRRLYSENEDHQKNDDNKTAPGVKLKKEFPLLHLAVIKGNYKIVEKLLAAKCDINALDSQGASAIMYAINQQNEKMIDLLLKNGCDVNLSQLQLKDTQTSSPYSHEDDDTPKEKIKVSLHHLTNEINFFDSCQEDIVTPLKLAIYNPEIVLKLLDAGAHICASKQEKIPILFYALGADYHKSLKSFKLLVAHGASLTATTPMGMTLLMYAAQLKNKRETNFLEMLLSDGHDIHKTDTDGDSALFYATRAPLLEAEANVKQLIAKGAQVNIKNRFGISPLLWAVAFQNNGVVKILISAKATIDVSCDAKFFGILLMAGNEFESTMRQNDLEKWPMFEEKGADNKYTIQYTPLLLALRLGNREILNTLFENGATFANQTEQALTLLANRHASNLKLIEIMLKYVDFLPAVTEENKYLFHNIMYTLLEANQLTLLEKFVNAGFHFNFSTEIKKERFIGRRAENNKRSVLLLAVQHNSFSMVQLLLAQGAQTIINDVFYEKKTYTEVHYKKYGREKGEWRDVYDYSDYDADDPYWYDKQENIVDTVWEPKAAKRKEKEICYTLTLTPLLVAIQNGNKEIVDLLLENGANPNAMIYREKYISALHMAITLKQEAIVKSLLAYHADVTPVCTITKEMLEKITFKGKPAISGTPMHLAIYEGNLSMVEILLTQKTLLLQETASNIRAENLVSFEKLEMENYSKEMEDEARILEILILETVFSSPIAFAVKQYQIDILKLLFLNGLKEKTGEANSLLLTAAKENNEEIFSILVENDVFLSIAPEKIYEKLLKKQSTIPEMKQNFSWLNSIAESIYKKIPSSHQSSTMTFKQAKLFKVLIYIAFARNIIKLSMPFTQQKRLLSHTIHLLVATSPEHLVNCLEKILTGKLLKEIDAGLMTGMIDISLRLLKLKNKPLYARLNFMVAMHLLSQQKLSQAVLHKCFVHALGAGEEADARILRRQLMNILLGNKGIPTDMQAVGLNSQNFSLFAEQTRKIVAGKKAKTAVALPPINTKAKDDNVLTKKTSPERRMSL